MRAELFETRIPKREHKFFHTSAGQLWLLRAERVGAPKEDQVRVRRALGHLVNDLGGPAVNKYKAEWTFQAAETLYGLSAIPQR